MGNDLNQELSKKTMLFGLKVWEAIGIGVGLFIISILCILSHCLTSRNKKLSRKSSSLATNSNTLFPLTQIPSQSKDMKAIQATTTHKKPTTIHKMDNYSSTESGSLVYPLSYGYGSQSGDEGSSSSTVTTMMYRRSTSPTTVHSPLSGMPEVSQLGWGYWFTLREVEVATNFFSEENLIGEGGYGVVYKGCLLNGTEVAVKKIFNGQ